MPREITFANKYELYLSGFYKRGSQNVAALEQSGNSPPRFEVVMVVSLLGSYVNATHLLRAQDRSVLDWLRSKKSVAAVQAAANVTGIPSNQLVTLANNTVEGWEQVDLDDGSCNIVARTTDNAHIGGIYIHPCLLFSLASFISPAFVHTVLTILNSHSCSAKKILHFWNQTRISPQSLAAQNPDNSTTFHNDMEPFPGEDGWTKVILSCWWQEGVIALLRARRNPANPAHLVLIRIDDAPRKLVTAVCKRHNITLTFEDRTM